MVTDITEVREQQNIINRIQRLETIGQLAAGISHDFNNILSVIDGNRELIELKNNDDSLNKYLDNITKATEPAKGLTRRLLLSSKRSVSPTAPKSSLIQSINESKALWTEITPTNVSVNWALNEQADTNINSDEFQDVFNNLYVNAMNALGENGEIQIVSQLVDSFLPSINAYIYIDPAKCGQYVKLSVVDNGCGITPDLYEKILTPFVSTSHKKVVTGLGLAMVAGFASRYNYGVTLESKVNRGTEITLWFPHSGSPVSESIGQHSISPLSPNNLKIVVIDDEKDVLEMLCEVIRLLDHTPIGFHDAAAGTAWIRANKGKFDLIISDVIMPGTIQGKDIYDQFSSFSPVLLMSGFHDLDAKEQLGKMILEEPFNVETLANAIAETMRDA